MLTHPPTRGCVEAHPKGDEAVGILKGDYVGIASNSSKWIQFHGAAKLCTATILVCSHSSEVNPIKKKTVALAWWRMVVIMVCRIARLVTSPRRFELQHNSQAF